MGWFDFLKRDRSSPGRERGWFAQGEQQHQMYRLAVGAPGDPYSTHAVVYRCVSTIARTLSGVPLQLFTGEDDDKEPVSDGPWYRLFLSPNPQMTRRQLWEATISYLQLQGECLWVLEGAGEQIGEHEVPLELWPIPGSCAEAQLDTTRRVLLGWKVSVGTQALMLPTHAVIQFKLFNPANPWRGLSPMAAAMAGFRQDSKASAFNEAFYDNGADPGGVLTSEQPIAPQKRAELKKAWEDRHRGASKAYRVAVLGNGLDYKQLQYNHRDMQFLEQRRWNREEIAMVYGVPKWFLGVSDDLNYATAQSAERILWTSTLIPLARIIEDQLEAQLFRTRSAASGQVQWAEFDTGKVEALRDDLQLKVQAAEGLRRLGYPLNAINERLDLGMEAQPGGDVGLLPLGLVPANQLGLDEDEPPAPAAPAPAGGLDDQDDPADQDEDRQRAASPERVRRVQTWEQVERAAFTPIETRFYKRLRGYLRGRRAEVLEALKQLNRAEGDSRIEEFLARAKERWDAMLLKQLDPLYRHAVEAGAATLGQQIGGLKHFDVQSPEVLQFLAQKSLKVKGVNDTILKHLRRTLLEGLGEGETISELQERVRFAFNTSSSRARRIARTESAQTINGARSLAMAKEGIRRVEWIASNDSEVRPSHRLLDGQIRELGESFLPGMTLRHPGDLEAPAQEVVHCRCTLGPVLD